MPIFATAGAKFHIGGALPAKSSDFVVTDFDGETWVEVKDTENLGTFGDSANEVSVDLIGEARTRRLKGTRNAGTMELQYGLNYADPGQLALIAAEKTNLNYAFKVTFNDAPDGGTPSERYFVAIVGSASEALNSANDTMMGQTTLWVNSNIVHVAAAAA